MHHRVVRNTPNIKLEPISTLPKIGSPKRIRGKKEEKKNRRHFNTTQNSILVIYCIMISKQLFTCPNRI